MKKVLQMAFGPVEIAGSRDDAWLISACSWEAEPQIEFIDLALTAINVESVPPEITLRWRIPMIDIQYRWAHACCNANHIPADWSGPLRSNLASNSPLLVLAGNDSTNRMTVARSRVNSISEAVPLRPAENGKNETAGILWGRRVNRTYDARGQEPGRFFISGKNDCAAGPRLVPPSVLHPDCSGGSCHRCIHTGAVRRTEFPRPENPRSGLRRLWRSARS